MNAFFGLNSFAISDVTETHRAVHCEVDLVTRPACPKCGDRASLTLHGRAKAFRVRDTPSRGRPTLLEVRRRRYRCEACPGRPTVVERGPDVADQWKVTKRLLRYIENAVTEQPIAHVAKATGVSETTVRNIALDLSERLEAHHRFPTPKVLAIDGISISRADYNVFADAWTGRPIGIIATTRAPRARAWLGNQHKPGHIDPGQVAIFVSDLQATNISLAGNPLGHTLHVADKWHVIRRYQKPLGGIISQEIDRLRKTTDPDPAVVKDAKALGRELWELKPALLAVDPKNRKTRKKKNKPQLTLSFDDFRNVFKKVPRVRRAYWARYSLIHMYRATNERDAQRHLDDLYRRLSEFRGMPQVKTFINHIENNKLAIFNYFRCLRTKVGGGFQGPTTNALEQRNSIIRQTWRTGRGIHVIELLRLRVLYAPWHIGTEIVECHHPDCPTFVGPLAGPPCPDDIRQRTGVFPVCALHAT